MRYCLSKFERDQQEKAYRIYVTDALQIISENTARQSGGQYIQARFVDVLHRKPANDKTCEEITADIVARCGLEVTNNEPV